MTTRRNISSVITTVYSVLLLCGTLFFTPAIFVSRYITPPQLWLQGWLGIGLLMYAFLKKGNIELPPPGYIVLILAWFCYRMVRSNWNFESLAGFLTVIIAFLLFYRYWKEIPGTYILFALFVCLGLILSVWGLGQYAGWIPGIYKGFTMTGPFNNPAGISASLALLYPFALYFCYKSKGTIGRLSIVASLLMLVTVILCGARAAILSVVVSTVIFIIHILKKRFGISFSFLHCVTVALVTILLFAGMYFMKKDSADGRLLIWHCSGQLIKQAPLFGYGNNGFTSCYMTEQADYFSRNPDSKYTMLADNVRHPFNEFIKVMVEYGITGLLLTLLLLIYPFYLSRKSKSMELSVIRISILSLSICALFSYPLYYPFIRIIVVILFAGLISGKAKSTTYKFNNNYFSKSTIALISIFILVITIYQVRTEREWKTIANYSLSGFTEEMLSEYQKLYSDTYLKDNASFLYNYAAELNISGYYSESNIILQECCNYMNDMEVQMLLANNYEKEEDYISAEQCLFLADRMVPVRFFPLYRLAKLYEKNHDYEKACKMAKRIIQKEIKIPSMKITVMKSEMEEIITKYQTNEGKEKGLPPNVGNVEAKTDIK